MSQAVRVLASAMGHTTAVSAVEKARREWIIRWVCDIANACQVVEGAAEPDLPEHLARLRGLCIRMPELSGATYFVIHGILFTTLSRLARRYCAPAVSEVVTMEFVRCNLDYGTLSKVASRVLSSGLWPQRRPATSALDTIDPRIQRAIIFIDAHLGDSKLRVQEIAQHVRLSPSYFDKLFVRVMRCRLRRYIRDVRLSQAERELRNTTRSVKDICFTVGYPTVSSFCRDFRLKYRVSPGSCRTS